MDYDLTQIRRIVQRFRHIDRAGSDTGDERRSAIDQANGRGPLEPQTAQGKGNRLLMMGHRAGFETLEAHLAKRGRSAPEHPSSDKDTEQRRRGPAPFGPGNGALQIDGCRGDNACGWLDIGQVRNSRWQVLRQQFQQGNDRQRQDRQYSRTTPDHLRKPCADAAIRDQAGKTGEEAGPQQHEYDKPGNAHVYLPFFARSASSAALMMASSSSSSASDRCGLSANSAAGSGPFRSRTWRVSCRTSPPSVSTRSSTAT